MGRTTKRAARKKKNRLLETEDSKNENKNVSNSLHEVCLQLNARKYFTMREYMKYKLCIEANLAETACQTSN